MVGFGHTRYEFYLIFKDGTRSDRNTKTDLNEFNECYFDPVATQVRQVRVRICNESSAYPGELHGIELLDKDGFTMLKIGEF